VAEQGDTGRNGQSNGAPPSHAAVEAALAERLGGPMRDASERATWGFGYAGASATAVVFVEGDAPPVVRVLADDGRGRPVAALAAPVRTPAELEEAVAEAARAVDGWPRLGA
jgi:hypothetical protein